MTTERSWHPAFKPNSATDIVTKDTVQSSNPPPETEPIVAAVKPAFPSETVFKEIIPDGKVGNSTIDSHEEVDNDGYSELDNLRDALTTSLASPGGVELEEIPLHNGNGNGASSADAILERKGDFPSEAPTPSNKHLSTMSFARTVSEEVNWGEDDEGDPEWNLQRTDTDPFKSMPKIDRTNSFPQVPPAHPHSIRFEPLRGQAEEIMNEVEQEPRDLFGDEDHGEDDFFKQQAAPNRKSRDFQDDHINDTNEAFLNYGQTFGGDARQEEAQDSQTRFEEGLPLVQSSQKAQEVSAANVDAFSDAAGDEDDFFTKVGKQNKATKEGVPAPPLERKTTMQVMDSLHFQPHQQTHDPILEEEEDQISSSQSSLEKVTGGGIAVSASTILSQVLGDPEASIHDQPDVLAGLAMESGDGDLAEKWKAALAGDEFLDDEDDFLADDEPSENKALDPADLFPDDEGFLEGTEDLQASTDLFAQQISPPIPAPVLGPDGHVVGFNNLTQGAQTGRPGISGSRPGSSGRYLPAGAQTAATPPAGNPYTPTAPAFADLTRSATTSAIPPPYASPVTATVPGQVAQPPRPEPHKALSFADKSKGGYHSPYDLPMDIVKPRKRHSVQAMHTGYNQSAQQAPATTPRSSSMYTQPPPPPRTSTSSLSPPVSSHSLQQSQLQNASLPQTKPAPPTLKSKASFFEELPMTARPRTASRHPSNPSVQGQHAPTLRPQQPPSGSHDHPQQPPPQPAAADYGHPLQQAPTQPIKLTQGLVAPERVSPYASLPSGNAPTPAVASRYSPAPPSTHSHMGPPPPLAQSRYSPAPPQQQRAHSYHAPSVNAPTPPILPHQPRTSSPLAHFSHDSRSNSHTHPASFDRRTSSSYELNLKPHNLPPTREVDESDDQAINFSEPPNQYVQPPLQPPFGTRPTQSPPPPQGLAGRMGSSPPKRTGSSNYMPRQSSAPAQTFLPPKRSQTQSPGTAFTGPRLQMSNSDSFQRPASVELPTSPRTPSGRSATPIGRSRGFSQGLDYLAPTDGREHDPLQRWRGSPVFAWGVGGTMVTSFPKDVPRYMNQSIPMILRSPGEIKIRNAKDVDPLQERITSFPGPLKGRSKKKDVVAWLGSGIQILEHNASYLRTLSTLSHEDKRTEERILLWKILQVFIENDGTLEGNEVVDEAVRSILSPDLVDQPSGSAPLYATGADLSGISHSSTTGTKEEVIDPSAVDQLRKHLLRGDRENAVWYAVEKRLWAHAMLISNTVSKDLYSKVAQEFVQKEIKNIGENTESLAALYEIFAGNFEEAVDELVPPSTRAGFQMVSTASAAGRAKDALDGLDRWRETLGLVLSNRSTNDNVALNNLGKLLSGYGRAEAAHICFLFARTHSIFGGIDDPQASIVLVGSDHMRQPYEFDRELEPILLSEVYEYGNSLSNTSNAAMSSPHLVIYKLQHALTLTENGYREKALQYCEAIAASVTSQTRRSPYHHALFVAELDDLSKRLKQSPKDEKSSWISKPSVDKVSNSVWSTFNKFVAGDETDERTPGSNEGSSTEVGPFARIAGGTPSLSRSPSHSDLYGSYNGGIGINGTLAQASKMASRYAPSGSYTPPVEQGSFQPESSYGSQSRASLERRSSGELRRGPYEPFRQSSGYQSDSQQAGHPYNFSPDSSFPPQSVYTPYGNDSPYADTGSPYSSQPPAVNQQPGSPLLRPVNSFTPPVHTFDNQQPASYMSPQTSYEPQPSPSYEPPSDTGYEPPSYEPATMIDEPDSTIDTRPKKKSFMDDDDDDIPAVKRAPDSQEKNKAEKDREADEAFRKAAEADAARAKEAAPTKKGWGLGGWFAKKESTDMSAQPNKPIRAKLGEESSFVYDPNLKRWVNKKGGADDTPAASATPPPPRAAGPPRIPSSSVPGPTSAPRMDTPPTSRAPSTSSDRPRSDTGSAPLPAGGLAAPPPVTRSASNGSVVMGPPSRPGTGMGNASSIDDLLGAATGGRKGTAKAKKKGRGYIDVMGKDAA